MRVDTIITETWLSATRRNTSASVDSVVLSRVDDKQYLCKSVITERPFAAGAYSNKWTRASTSPDFDFFVRTNEYRQARRRDPPGSHQSRERYMVHRLVRTPSPHHEGRVRRGSLVSEKGESQF